MSQNFIFSEDRVWARTQATFPGFYVFTKTQMLNKNRRRCANWFQVPSHGAACNILRVYWSRNG